ncbi:MAG: ABC transporter ATP-binding protein [Deltaproteobacteria bacterium]|nr:ABC transporter ATP-binding protein [Deltaproteobacteria bacterium]
MALLEGHGLTKKFGGVQALTDVDFVLNKGEIVGLIGPNGAGKTTLFNLIAGAFKPTSGRVIFNGIDITSKAANQTCRLGIARTFQVTRPFPEMTCLENVGVSINNSARQTERGNWRESAQSVLKQMGLHHRHETLAKSLNLIEKKKLEMARALATKPDILLLDEVLGGLNSQEIQESVNLIQGLREDLKLTIFWIEHVMGAIMKAADRVIVLDQGANLMDGTPEEVVGDDRVIKAYLGE